MTSCKVHWLYPAGQRGHNGRRYASKGPIDYHIFYPVTWGQIAISSLLSLFSMFVLSPCLLLNLLNPRSSEIVQKKNHEKTVFLQEAVHKQWRYETHLEHFCFGNVGGAAAALLFAPHDRWVRGSIGVLGSIPKRKKLRKWKNKHTKRLPFAPEGLANFPQLQI